MCTLQGGCERHGLGVLLMTSTDEGGDCRAALLHPLFIPFLLTLFVMKTVCFLSSHFPTPSSPDQLTIFSLPVCGESSSLPGMLHVASWIYMCYMCEWMESKSERQRTCMQGKVYVKCQLGHVSLVSTRFQTLKSMTHVSNASTCLLIHPALIRYTCCLASCRTLGF